MSGGTNNGVTPTPFDPQGSKQKLRWIGDADRLWDVMYGCLLSEHDHYFTIRRTFRSLILGKQFRVEATFSHPSLPAEEVFPSLIECMHWAEIYLQTCDGNTNLDEIAHPLT